MFKPKIKSFKNINEEWKIKSVIFNESPFSDLIVDGLNLSNEPYIHVDVYAHSKDDGAKKYIFGVPLDEKGYYFYVFEKNKVLNFENQRPKISFNPSPCPLCNSNFILTKVFILNDRNIRVQWKCENCALVYHRNYRKGDVVYAEIDKWLEKTKE